MKRNEGAVVIYYGVPRKSAAIAWQKDLFRFLPVGQGDMKCCLLRIYLRLSARASHEAYRGPRKSVDFWGEEKWRQAKPRIASFILQAHFDEGAVAIYYGVRSMLQVAL